MTNMCRRMLCQLLLMLTFCFLLVPAMRNANNQNANSTNAYDSNGLINGSGYERYNADDLNDLYGGHHNDHAEPSTSNSQNVLSSDPEATSGPKNDWKDENIQKALAESYKEEHTKLNNAKNAAAKLKMVKAQSEVDEYLRQIAEAEARNDDEALSRENEIPTRQELPNESDGLNKLEEEALNELIDGKGKALSKLNENSRLKVLNAANELGMDTSAFGQQPSRENEITTRQETPNELKVRNVAKKLGVEESSTSAVGQQPQRENEITTRQETPNESDGLGDLEEEALEKLNEKVLSKLNEKSRLKVPSDVDQQTKGAPVKVSPNSNEHRSRKKSSPAGGWDDKANQYYEDSSKKSMAPHGGTLSAKSPLKGDRKMLSPGAQLRQMSLDELKALERRVKKQLEKEKMIKKAVNRNDTMPPASYGNMSQSDIDRRLAKLKERSNYSEAPAQIKKAKEEKQKRGHFDKNLSESSTDSS